MLSVKGLVEHISKLEDMLNTFGVAKQEQDAVEAGRKFQAELGRMLVGTIEEWVSGSRYHGLSNQEYDALNVNRNKILAIKYYRERTGQGLKEAKDFVEDAMERIFGYRSFPVQDGYPRY